MSKQKYSNRLEQLFSSVEFLIPEPDSGPENDLARRQEEKELNPVEPVSQEIAQRESDQQVQEIPEEGRTEAFTDKLEKSGWEDFLDGIHNPEKIGFAFDQEQIRALSVTDFLNSEDRSEMKQTIEVGGKSIGQIAFQADGRPWKREEEQLVQVVTQRLAQQIDNLRLLEQSQRFQQEAETAFQQLSRNNWDQYLRENDVESLAFTYDLNQVQPLKGRQIPESPETRELDLKARDHLIGKLVIDSPHKMDASTEVWVKTIAERLSVHLDGLRLNEQREQALAESELLYEISARLSTSDSLQAVLNAMAQPAIVARADHTQLYLIERDSNGQPATLKLVAVWGREGVNLPMPVGFRLNLADMPSSTLWLNDPENPLISSDLSQDMRLDAHTRSIFARDGIQSAALLPLAVGRNWIGIALFNWNEPHAFSEVERRLYKALAGQAAVVMNNIILLEQTQERAREMETVARVSTAASSLLSPAELLQSVVELTQENFDLYHTQVYLVDEDGLTLSVRAGTGEVGRRMVEEGQPVHLQEGTSVVAQAARSREFILVKDCRKDETYIPHPLLPDTRSQLVIPMIVGDLLLGVLDVQSEETNRFTNEDVRTYATLAAQIAVALQNANLYVEQGATVERLRELDHLKSDFLANMSHELRTPLNSILGFTDVILLGIDGALTEQMQSDLTLIEKNGKHLLGLINDVLDMAKIESGRMRLGIETFELHEVLQEAIDLTSSLAREKGIALEMHVENDKSIVISADRTRLRQVLLNLLGNAVKFTEEGQVSVCAKMRKGRVRIEVKDTGLGIPRDKLEMIFESFSQVDTSTTRKVGGTGLGLPISRSLVEMHGGKVWAESPGIPGEGSTFIVELPHKSVEGNDDRD